MKRNYIQLMLWSLMASLLVCACSEEPTTVQFMSYNIRNGNGIDNVKDLNRIVTAIQKQDPDVLACQEVDSVTTRCNGEYTLGILAERTNRYATYAPAINFQGGKYGIGMLSKEKPLSHKQYQLPGREEQRTLLVVEFEKYVYCCTHLSLTPEDQLLSLPIINEIAKAYQKPFFLAGDLNAHPDSEFIKGLQQDFNVISSINEYTFPADQPNETIDYIAVRQQDAARVTVVTSEVVNEPAASDHRPIATTVVLN